MDDIVEFMTVYYNKPWMRALPYLVGIFVGWALHETRNHQVKIPKVRYFRLPFCPKNSTILDVFQVLVALTWTLAAATGLSIVYGLVPYLHREVEISEYINIFYGSLHRFAWSLALGWVIFACVKGHGGWFPQTNF